MGYFSADDLHNLDKLNDAHETLRQRFHSLHKTVYKTLTDDEINLNLVVPDNRAVDMDSVSDIEVDETLTVGYLRQRGQAVTVERLMGREEVASINNLLPKLHPVVEMRLWQGGFVIELVLSPDAWWDQQNLKGKLTVARHKYELYNLLTELNEKYIMGFWQGTHLSDMHLKAQYFQHPRILDEWLSTFHPNADWFRIGIWYDIDDEDLAEARIVEEVTQQIHLLYEIYLYILWTSENNFRDFYSS